MSDHNDARALRIIVVDDEEDFTALISDVFELLGFSVQTCATAAAARPLVEIGRAHV